MHVDLPCISVLGFSTKMDASAPPAGAATAVAAVPRVEPYMEPSRHELHHELHHDDVQPAGEASFSDLSDPRRFQHMEGALSTDGYDSVWTGDGASQRFTQDSATRRLLEFSDDENEPHEYSVTLASYGSLSPSAQPIDQPLHSQLGSEPQQSGVAGGKSKHSTRRSAARSKFGSLSRRVRPSPLTHGNHKEWPGACEAGFPGGESHGVWLEVQSLQGRSPTRSPVGLSRPQWQQQPSPCGPPSGGTAEAGITSAPSSMPSSVPSSVHVGRAPPVSTQPASGDQQGSTPVSAQQGSTQQAASSGMHTPTVRGSNKYPAPGKLWSHGREARLEAERLARIRRAKMNRQIAESLSDAKGKQRPTKVTSPVGAEGTGFVCA